MHNTCDNFVLWFAIAVQAWGVLSVAAARLSERSWAGVVFQRMFYVSLLAVGLTAILSVASGTGHWLACGATLGAMSIGATLDCSPNRRSPAF
jgi:hypothetical protein